MSALASTTTPSFFFRQQCELTQEGLGAAVVPSHLAAAINRQTAQHPAQTKTLAEIEQPVGVLRLEGRGQQVLVQNVLTVKCAAGQTRRALDAQDRERAAKASGRISRTDVGFTGTSCT